MAQSLSIHICFFLVGNAKSVNPVSPCHKLEPTKVFFCRTMASHPRWKLSKSSEIRVCWSDIGKINIKTRVNLSKDIHVFTNIRAVHHNTALALGMKCLVNKTYEPQTQFEVLLSMTTGKIINQKTFHLSDIEDPDKVIALQALSKREMYAYALRTYLSNEEKYVILILTLNIGHPDLVGTATHTGHHKQQIIHAIEPDNHAWYLHAPARHQTKLAQAKFSWTCNPYQFENIIDKYAKLIGISKL